MRLVDLVGVAGMRVCGCRRVLDLGCMLLSTCTHGDGGLDLARVARLTCGSAVVRMEDGGVAAPHMRVGAGWLRRHAESWWFCQPCVGGGWQQ